MSLFAVTQLSAASIEPWKILVGAEAMGPVQAVEP
jgi:hypothetical protein